MVLLELSGNVMAQKTNILENKWFNHIDAGFSFGTSGLGFDFSTPMSKWARLRVGGVFSPSYHYNASFGMEVAEGLSEAEQNRRFQKLSETMEALTGKATKSTVDMQATMNMNNFKMLVDIYPFKDCHKFYLTVGFYYGNSTIVDVHNTPESMRNLEAINTYNSMYKKALAKESLIDLEGLGIKDDGSASFEKANEKLRGWGARPNGTSEKGYNEGDVPSDINTVFGVDPTANRYFAEYGISIPMGELTHDIVAQEDIYYDYTEVLDNPYYIDDNNGGYTQVQYRTDSNGRIIKKGEIKYKKGEVMQKAGETLHFVPDENNTVNVSAKVNKFKPYIGVGYCSPITKDKRTNISVNAGVMFWGGKPSVDIKTPMGVDADGNIVYCSYDLVRDVKNLPGKVDKYINLVKKLPVFPELSISISQRLW